MNRQFDNGFFAGVALIVVGAAFLVLTVLPGAASSTLLPALLFAITGLWFVGMAFVPAARWWPLVPGGVLLSLSATILAAPDSRSGGVFLGGLGLTFLAVFLAPPASRQRLWALITAVVLLLLAILAAGVTGSAVGIALAIALIACGVLLLLRRPGQVS